MGISVYQWWAKFISGGRSLSVAGEIYQWRSKFISGGRIPRMLDPPLLCIRARVYACRKCFQWTRASAPEIKKHDSKTFSAASLAAEVNLARIYQCLKMHSGWLLINASSGYWYGESGRYAYRCKMVLDHNFHGAERCVSG